MTKASCEQCGRPQDHLYKAEIKRHQFRQGDVFLECARVLPADVVLKARDAGRVIVEYGEITGHAHQIKNPDAVGAEILLSVAESATFVKLAKKALLVHEEHSTATITEGIWKRMPQVEETPWGVRQVVD